MASIVTDLPPIPFIVGIPTRELVIVLTRCVGFGEG